MADSRPGAGAFAAGEKRWAAGLGSLRDVVRQRLVARQLTAHLPPVSIERPVRVLDVGCGQGTQAIRLARAGYTVTGLDPSTDLLERARAGAAIEADDVEERVTWVRGDLFAFAHSQRGQWDVVCCHWVVMYLPSLSDACDALVDLVRPGGMVSVLSRNRAGIAMRAGMSGHWDDAMSGFDRERYTNRLGLDDVRADRPLQVRNELIGAGCEIVAWYGVRLFTDHWDTDAPLDDLDEIVAVEEQAGCRDPYRELCALTHTLATRRR